MIRPLFTTVLFSAFVCADVSAQGTWSLSLNLLQHRMQTIEQLQNTCLSPMSLQMAMALTASGTQGKTRREIVRAMGFQQKSGSFTFGKGQSSFSSLLSAYSADDSPVISANAVWLNANFAPSIDNTYLNTCKQTYDAEAQAISYNASGVRTINDWVKAYTRQRIPKLIDQLDAKNGVLTLTNALTFDGNWRTTFDERNTKPASFTLLKDRPKQVSMMYNPFRHVSYLEDEVMQGICLPYKVQGEVSTAMHVFLPRQGVSLPDMLSHLIALMGKQNELMYADDSYVKLHLPKFSMSCNYDLIPDLMNLGIKRAFLPGNKDFNPIIRDVPLKVSLVQQATFIEVNETGTRAAAATAVGIMVGASRPRQIDWKEMNVDRPFVYVIEDVTRHLPLFVGFVTCPE